MNKITERVGTLHIDNFIKNKLYIKYKKLRINLMYKIYMGRQPCPP